MKNSLPSHRGVATNSILLALVQCLTMARGILQTMVMSRVLTETEYGTYLEGMTVVGFFAPFFLLGLANAITYFSGQKDIDKKQYVNSIISLILIIGGLGAILLVALRAQIIGYFNNEGLRPIILIISVMPLLQNMIVAFQTLYVAEDMASSIVVRNAVVAVAQLGLVMIGLFVFHTIVSIFWLLLLLDAVQLFLFWTFFTKRRYSVCPVLVRKDVAERVFRYAVPLALSTAIGTLSIYMDKLLIGRLMTVEDFALYSNMAKELPVEFIATSFTTVIMPVIIQKHADDDDAELTRIWKKYLELGYTVTWIICGTAIACSKDLLLLLYSEKYVAGLPIFVVYQFVSFFRFTYYGLVLSAFGRTRVIMMTSIVSLVCNFVLNYLLFMQLGIIGPAIASLITILLAAAIQMLYSCHLLRCKLKDAFDLKHVSILLLEMLCIGGAVAWSRSFFDSMHYVIRLMICGLIMGAALGLLNWRRIRRLIVALNHL